MPIVFFCSSAGKYPRSWGACAFYAPIYSFQFNSIHFISFLFYSAWRKKRNVTNDNENNEKNEKNETLRMITKITKITNDNENNENNEILRKKGNTLIKNHVIVIFYAKTVYFFIHLKNVFIAFFLIFVHFPFFSLISFLFVICELRFYLVKKL